MKSATEIRKAIYPGTFDPVTNGHLSLIERACNLFDRVIVAVAGKTAGKNALFTFDERVKLMQGAVSEIDGSDRIEILRFDSLLANLVKEHHATAIIRGLRAVSDFEYEFQMALMNRKLAREAETVFLMPALSWVYLSSSIVKDVALNGGDITDMVPPLVQTALQEKYKSIKQ